MTDVSELREAIAEWRDGEPDPHQVDELAHAAIKYADLLDGPLRVIGEGRVRELKTWDLLRRIDALTNDSTSQTEEVIAKIDKFRKELRAALGVEDSTP